MDAEIGSGIIRIDAELWKKGKISSWFPIVYKGNEAGEIFLDIELYSGSQKG